MTRDSMGQCMFEVTPRLLAQVLGQHHAPPRRLLGGSRNRCLMNGSETEGRFALVQHLLDPWALGSPMQRHTHEDQYLYVLSGEIRQWSSGDEVRAKVGDSFFKPRGDWHTFWNSSDEPASVLEIVSPAGCENFFTEFAELSGPVDEKALTRVAAEHGLQFDWSATSAIVRRHGLTC
ncbi:cupin domain-containing protein [Embleya sp. NPDC050493]|uniref:cupin domain-containing protein n=1 Tax=Embleya sp. NPDC050493 TaxID=3363989 RepID=UPI00379B5604